MENRIINGGFERWSLGTSFSTPANDVHVADAWQIQTGGGTPATYVVSKDLTNNDSVGGTCLKFDVTNAGSGITNSLRVQQRIENVKDYLGKTISVSVRVKTSVANKVRFVVDASDAGVYSSYHTGSGNYETLTVTRSIPDTTTLLRLKIGMSSVDIVTGVFYVDNVMFTVSASPEDYVALDPAVDEQMCARRVQTRGSATTPCYLYSEGYSDGTHYAIGCYQPFSVEMANTPTINVTVVHVSEDGSQSQVEANYTTTYSQPSSKGFVAYAYKSVTGSRPASFSFYWTAQSFLT